MVRDYSAFLPTSTNAAAAGCAPTALETLGWGPFFAQQLDAEALTDTPPVRVVAVHRSGLQVAGDGIEQSIPPGVDATVGDWLLLDRARPRASPVLSRKSLVKRRAPGTDRQVQLVAANIDTAFVVTSCNRDFNVARLERYVALAFDAGIEPVIVLTKADLVPDRDRYLDAARTVSERVAVVALDAPAKSRPSSCRTGAGRAGRWCSSGRRESGNRR